MAPVGVIGGRSRVSLERQLADYTAALAWVGRLMTATGASQLADPTPCAGFTVRDLMGHLLGTAHRGLGTARGEPTGHVPHVITDVPDDELATGYVRLAAQVGEAWRAIGSPDRVVVAPWGEVRAEQAVEGFTVETLVHGWDLAVATGQDPEELAEVAARCRPVVPDRLRGEMYDDPVPVAGDDGATTRLARFLGSR